MKLNDDHIDYVIRDLNQRGLVADDIRDEVIDHVCSAVECEMNNGLRFIDAYNKVLRSFGQNTGLRKTQKQILTTRNKTTRIMLKNYITIAFRNLRKHSFYTIINVAGLAVGIAACLLILVYINNELSYDKHFENADRIFRVETEVKFGANHLRLATNAAPMAEALRNDYPEVEHAGRVWQKWPRLVRRTDQNIKETDVAYADSSILKVFAIPFLKGNPDNALSDPFTMVISKTTADKYFPNEDAVGQTLIIQNKDAYKVTGVFEDMPSTSHFHFTILLAGVTDPYHKDGQWLSSNFNTYVKLKPGTDYHVLNSKLPQLIEKFALPQLKMGFGNDFTMAKFNAAGNLLEWRLRPVTDIHLHSDLMAELEPNGDITYVYLFGAIGAFILAIACINFMNLSTARSANRAKEVGVRKVMGSLRSHLVRQFLTESILLSAFSFLLAVLIAFLAMPFFNELAAKALFIPFGEVSFYMLAAVTIIVIGVMAGLYPSLFLSAFKPVNVLKGNVTLGMKSGLIRSSLVVFQFSISILLIIGTIAVNRQLNFIQNKKVGFNKDQVIIIKDAYALDKQVQTFKEEVMQDSRILAGTISGYLPVGGSDRSDTSYWPEGSQPTQDNLVNMQCWRVDYDYLATFGMKMKNGRFFSKDFASDSAGVILNETAVKMYGFKGDPVGQKISQFADDGGEIDRRKTIQIPVIGVVEDFNFESLKKNVGALGFFLKRSTGLASFRFEAKDTKEVISSIEKKWTVMAPGLPFSYSFLDQDFEKMYSSEQRLGKIFSVFAGLAIIIGCLGLFALTAFTAQMRTKEIGIRKVLGASVTSIMMLLSKEFGKLIVIAFLIAAPIAWYGVDWWLRSYSYKTEIGVLVYLIAGIAAFFIAWITMSFQSYKAASNDPVKSLRSE